MKSTVATGRRVGVGSVNFVALTGRVASPTRRSSVEGRYELRVRLPGVGIILVNTPTPAIIGSEVFFAGSLRPDRGLPQVYASELHLFGVAPTGHRSYASKPLTHEVPVARHQRRLPSGRVVWVKSYVRGAKHV